MKFLDKQLEYQKNLSFAPNINNQKEIEQNQASQKNEEIKLIEE